MPLLLLGRIATIASDSDLLLHTEYRGRSVCVCMCVCLLVMFASLAKTDEPIEMPFIGLIRVGPKNHVLGLHGSQGQTNPLAPRGVTIRRCGLLSKLFDYLL